MKFKTLFLASSLATTLSFSVPALADMADEAADIAGPTLSIGFDDYLGYETLGPETLAPGVTFTGDEGSVLGAFIADLGTNGIWGAGNVFAATGFVGELRFTFDELTSGAGALVNHYEAGGLPFAIVVSAYGDNNQIIESYTVTIDTDEYGYNEGIFLGITRASADIRSLSFKGNAVVVDDLVVAVPEPETYAMMLAGLGLLGLVARRANR